MDYWKKNKEKIKQGSNGRGVPNSVILGIMKVETNFGKHMGKHSVFNVYWSLALGDHPKLKDKFIREFGFKDKKDIRRLGRRANWGRKELRDLIYMTRHGGKHPVDLKGSWAGAFGLSQFIPSSYRHYSADGNQDGIVDLDNVVDASASIANYLKKNGWSNNKSRAKKKKVIMRYNISEYYADCVLALADSIETRW